MSFRNWVYSCFWLSWQNVDKVQFVINNSKTSYSLAAWNAEKLYDKLFPYFSYTLTKKWKMSDFDWLYLIDFAKLNRKLLSWHVGLSHFVCRKLRLHTLIPFRERTFPKIAETFPSCKILLSWERTFHFSQLQIYSFPGKGPFTFPKIAETFPSCWISNCVSAQCAKGDFHPQISRRMYFLLFYFNRVWERKWSIMSPVKNKKRWFFGFNINFGVYIDHTRQNSWISRLREGGKGRTMISAFLNYF